MAPDPYRYFRLEARDLLEQFAKGMLTVEKEGNSFAAMQHLLRLAHTLKGAARVVKQHEIADRAHAIEDALSPFRDAAGPMSRKEIDVVLHHLDDIGGRMQALDAPAPEVSPQPRDVPGEEVLRSVRADVTEIDAALDSVSEAHGQLNGLQVAMRTLEQARQMAALLEAQLAPRISAGPDPRFAMASELKRQLGVLDRRLGSATELLERELSQLRDRVEQLRLVPIGTLFTVLERTARDTAALQSKSVQFAGSGGDIRLDAHLLDILQAALVQIVRNAVAHGVETESDRRIAGKPAAGRVSVGVTRRGQRIIFECRDDGRG